MIVNNLLVKLRRYGFWTIDFFCGSIIKDAYNRIKKIDLADSDSKEVLAYNKNILEELLLHATNETGYYSKYKGKPFNEFPIIDKNIIRNNQNDFISYKYKINKLIKMMTSGSTGTPFVSYQDIIKKKYVNAEVIYYFEKIGYSFGENITYIRSLVKNNRKSKLKQIIQNQTLINCQKLDEENIIKIINEISKISKNKKVALLAYASTYDCIAKYYLKNGRAFRKCKIIGAVSGSEMLSDNTRKLVSNIFNGIKVASRYSNEENGVIGQDEDQNNIFVINEANYLVEIFDNNGCKCKDGEIGRIVVTDYYNYSQPYIRYDTGDIGSIETLVVNGRKKRCITNFSGRKIDTIFDTKGHVVSPHVITNLMWEYTNVKQFQLIQKGIKNYKLVMNFSKEDKQANTIIGQLKEILGEDSNITIETVREIPVLSSGKRRYIVNEVGK